MANVHNQKVIAQLLAQVKEYDEGIRHLEGRLREIGLAEAWAIEKMERGKSSSLEGHEAKADPQPKADFPKQNRASGLSQQRIASSRPESS